MTGLLIDDNGKLRVPTHGFQLLKLVSTRQNQLLDELGEYLKDKAMYMVRFLKRQSTIL